MLSKIILASKSKVRKEILEKNNIFAQVEKSNVDEESIKEEIKYDLILSEVVRKLKVIFDDCKIEQHHRKITDVYMNTAIHFLITIDWSNTSSGRYYSRY